MIEQVQQWQSLQEGKQAALEYFFRSYYEEMYHYASALLGDENAAQDQVQQFFLKLWEKHATLPSPSNVKAYLFRSLRFAIIDELRRRKRNRIVLFDGNASVFEWQTTSDSTLEENVNLHEALKMLSPGQQEILFLRFYNQIPYSEIAEITGMRYQSVRNAAHRGIKKLRATLKKNHSA